MAANRQKSNEKVLLRHCPHFQLPEGVKKVVIDVGNKELVATSDGELNNIRTNKLGRHPIRKVRCVFA